MDESLAEVRRELEAERRAGAARSGELGAEHGRLWTAVGDAMDGGKRLRPQLLLAANAGLGGSSGGAATRVAAALEVLHTALVIHDDVIDGDRVRRGRPNVSGRFAEDAHAGGLPAPAAARYADAAGILAGDLALLTAARMIATCAAEPATVSKLLGLLDDAVHAAAAGELADVRCGLGLEGDPALERTVEVAARKTASYSFELPLCAAAVLAGSPPTTVAALGRIGRHLGVGFQLLDDLLGVFGDESRIGKSTLGDLREGKATALIAHARSTPSWSVLEGLIGDPRLDARGAARARDALLESGARDAVQDQADLLLDRALCEARRAGLPAALVDALTGIVEDIRRTTAAALVPAPAAARAAS